MAIDTVGKFCKQFRIDVLNLTLTEFGIISETNIKNISAFEGGRANNIKYLFMYYKQCENDFLKDMFTGGVFKCVTEWVK